MPPADEPPELPPPWEPQPGLIPEGFPNRLDDEELEAAAEIYANELRQYVTKTGVGSTHEGVVLGFGTLFETARSEIFRRHLKRSERLARLALIVAIASALVTTAFSVTAAVVQLRDPTPDRLVEVRDRLPADAGHRELKLLVAIRRELAQRLSP